MAKTAPDTAAQKTTSKGQAATSPSVPSSPQSRTSASGAVKKKGEWTHRPPTKQELSANGRKDGRNLITWTRPRMAEKLLLHVYYECTRHRLDLPMDAIAHRFHPGSSGGAILQHLNRLRQQLVAEGHMVPPLAQKPGSRVAVDPNVRGYIRKDEESDNLFETRPVLFNEFIEDRRVSLPDAYDGGHFPNAPSTAQPNTISGLDPSAPFPGGVPPTPPPKGKGKSTKGKAKGKTVKKETLDPTDLDSDAEYDPKAEGPTKSIRRSARSKAKKTYAEEDNEEIYDAEDEFAQSEPEVDATEAKSADEGIVDVVDAAETMSADDNMADIVDDHEEAEGVTNEAIDEPVDDFVGTKEHEAGDDSDEDEEVDENVGENIGGNAYNHLEGDDEDFLTPKKQKTHRGSQLIMPPNYNDSFDGFFSSQPADFPATHRYTAMDYTTPANSELLLGMGHNYGSVLGYDPLPNLNAPGPIFGPQFMNVPVPTTEGELSFTQADESSGRQAASHDTGSPQHDINSDASMDPFVDYEAGHGAHDDETDEFAYARG